VIFTRRRWVNGTNYQITKVQKKKLKKETIVKLDRCANAGQLHGIP
jgi:hypothetical protein